MMGNLVGKAIVVAMLDIVVLALREILISLVVLMLFSLRRRSILPL